MAMFRRPLLGGLNHIWEFIVQCEGYPPVVKFPIPDEVQMEIIRFLGMIPIAYMDFRTTISSNVTASDASQEGGGVTVSEGVTPTGAIASHCPIRGDLMEPTDLPSVLTIGLFDGIGALRVASDVLGWATPGHVSVEKSPMASRVVESRFGGAIFVDDVQKVDKSVVQAWAQRFTQVSLVLLGAGPPCQGVSGLNASKKGALRDERSCLFLEVPRIRQLIRECFPWAQVKSFMESVASMSVEDQDEMSKAFGGEPVYIDAAGLSPAHRPRLYWVDWEICPGPDVTFGHTSIGRRSVSFHEAINVDDYLLPGWKRASDGKFPTFTTSRPKAKPGYKPAGVRQCQAHELARWQADSHRFPPYQYKDEHCVTNRQGAKRILSVEEREVMMGFPKGYTQNCLPKKDQGTQHHTDCRLTLVGNSWNVTVIAWLLNQLGSPLGFNPWLSVGDLVQRTAPGCTVDLPTFLQRPHMLVARSMGKDPQAKRLVERLLTLVSMKGEDIMLQSSHEEQLKYHRLRASIPANLWRWKTVTGWHWHGAKEHINVLEARAVLTSLRWRLERRKQTRVKFVHLIDSMVVLHALSRGRSSSRKLRRAILRINALLLATKSQAVWTYVHTKLNPADKPSRRPRKRKWSACQSDI